jgi:hypothetical protein
VSKAGAIRTAPHDSPTDAPSRSSYVWLTDLMVDLTLFVPDADLQAAEPFMTSGGGISGRAIDEKALAHERERVYTLFTAHREERERLLASATIDAGRNPIGKAIWTRSGRFRHYHRAEDGYAPQPEASEPPKPLDDAGEVRGVLFFGCLPGLVTSVVCAGILLVFGQLAAAVVTLFGGPVVAYGVCLITLFGGGKVVSRASAPVQTLFVTFTAFIGIPVALAIALAASGNPMWALLASVGTVVWVVVVMVYHWITD